MTDEAGSRRQTKVERVIETYGLEEWGARLESEWLGESGERTSLRALADRLNTATLRAALQAAGENPRESEVDRFYEALTDDDGSSTERVRTQRELERSGVDVEEIQSDFVTHQAVHTYLTRVRGAVLERDEDEQSRRNRKRETVQRLASRTEVVTESTLDELRRAELLTDRTYDVLVTVTAVCQSCGRTYTAAELIEEGGCDCP
ncbi:hypothetical protein OB905_00925 [Halobacteria archaeon AArc-dxtr1]|nr:hypothetical protein [Halobacteria archaeon AArc-dxtr1]